MLDYIVMAAGWLAFVCLAVWLYSQKKITPTQVFKFLDLMWDVPHIRAHFEKYFEDLVKKFEASPFGTLLNNWWHSDDENGDADAVADETEAENKKAKKKVKKAKKDDSEE